MALFDSFGNDPLHHSPYSQTANLHRKATLHSRKALQQFPGFSLESWQYDKCGYSEQRDVYTCMANDAYMIFDAGKNNAYTSAEIKVAYNSTGNYWAFTEEVHRKNGYSSGFR